MVRLFHQQPPSLIPGPPLLHRVMLGGLYPMIDNKSYPRGNP